MARRSREAIQKRQRERKRAEKAAQKRQKRLDRKKGLEAGELLDDEESQDGETPESTGEVDPEDETVAAPRDAEPAG